VLAAGDQRDVMPRLVKPGAENASDRTRAEDDEAHA
jgi:hypothetical protein